jgi:hypothetical protein
MTKDMTRKGPMLHITLSILRYGWPLFILLGILWFPFDWLSEVWPTFGVPFRLVFHSAHDHFIGHTIFFFIIGMLIISMLPVLSRQLHWYVLGLILAAGAQEAIQAYFRGELPTFTDFNAFRGDALGGMSAWMLWFILRLLYSYWKRRSTAKSLPGANSRSDAP